MTRRVFTAEFKQSTISLVIDQSYTSREAANRLGIGLTTFKYWLKQHCKRNGSAAAAEEQDLRKGYCCRSYSKVSQSV